MVVGNIASPEILLRSTEITHEVISIGRQHSVHEPADCDGRYFDLKKERKLLSGKSKRQEASSIMVFRRSGWQNTEGVSRALLLFSAQTRRRSATTGLTVEASLNHQLTVGVLSFPVKGVCQAWCNQASGKQDSCNTSAVSSKSNFVIPLAGFSQVTRSATMSAGHCILQTKFFPEPLGSIHTPPVSTPEASQKPSAVGRR